jgi:hypothetical protein
MIFKPGKPPTEVTTDRPISLLPIIAILCERLLLSRIEEEMPLNVLIPSNQSDFVRTTQLHSSFIE